LKGGSFVEKQKGRKEFAPKSDRQDYRYGSRERKSAGGVSMIRHRGRVIVERQTGTDRLR